MDSNCDGVMEEKEKAKEDKLELIATKSFKSHEEIYKIVDFLNKNLKHKKVMFGLSKNREKDGMIISIYEV